MNVYELINELKLMSGITPVEIDLIAPDEPGVRSEQPFAPPTETFPVLSVFNDSHDRATIISARWIEAVEPPTEPPVEPPPPEEPEPEEVFVEEEPPLLAPKTKKKSHE